MNKKGKQLLWTFDEAKSEFYSVFQLVNSGDKETLLISTTQNQRAWM
jgi:hypothetical protein